MSRNGGHVPGPGWRWPEAKDPFAGLRDPEVKRLAEEAFDPEIAQLRRDRDELAEALDAVLRWFDKLVPDGKEMFTGPEDARAVLARVKGR